jgi:hypothetical protein
LCTIRPDIRISSLFGAVGRRFIAGPTNKKREILNRIRDRQVAFSTVGAGVTAFRNGRPVPLRSGKGASSPATNPPQKIKRSCTRRSRAPTLLIDNRADSFTSSTMNSASRSRRGVVHKPAPYPPFGAFRSGRPALYRRHKPIPKIKRSSTRRSRAQCSHLIGPAPAIAADNPDSSSPVGVHLRKPAFGAELERMLRRHCESEATSKMMIDPVSQVKVN